MSDSAEPHAAALNRFVEQRVPQRIDGVIFATRVNLFGIARGVNHRGQSANQISGVATNY